MSQPRLLKKISTACILSGQHRGQKKRGLWDRGWLLLNYFQTSSFYPSPTLLVVLSNRWKRGRDARGVPPGTPSLLSVLWIQLFLLEETKDKTGTWITKPLEFLAFLYRILRLGDSSFRLSALFPRVFHAWINHGFNNIMIRENIYYVPKYQKKVELIYLKFSSTKFQKPRYKPKNLVHSICLPLPSQDVIPKGREVSNASAALLLLRTPNRCDNLH